MRRQVAAGRARAARARAVRALALTPPVAVAAPSPPPLLLVDEPARDRPGGGRAGVGVDPALRRRVSAGALLGVVVVGDTLLGGWFFAVLLLAAVVVGASEWTRLAAAGSADARRAVLACAMLPGIAVVLLGMAGSADAGLLVLAVGCLAGAGLAALVPGTPVNRAAGGVLYLGAPALSLLWLRNANEAGYALVLWLFFIVWATDTFAYVAGRGIGGPRLAPRLSPNKTWAGLAGGMAGAALVGGTFAHARGGTALLAAALAAALALLAQTGDLFESWLKRNVGLKDSGDLIPGHGGLLDRVDGLLFAAPAFAAIMLLSQSAAVR